MCEGREGDGVKGMREECQKGERVGQWGNETWRGKGQGR